MTELANNERDALIEICNVGMSRAAKQLSVLLNNRIDILIPQVELVDIDEYMLHQKHTKETLSAVSQSISKDLLGRSVLLFQKKHAAVLTRYIIGGMDKLSENEIKACEQESILETGNILITSCMSAIVNMLSLKVGIGTPRYDEGDLKKVIEIQAREMEKYHAELIVVITTTMQSEGSEIVGTMLLLLTKPSVDFLLSSISSILKRGG